VTGDDSAVPGDAATGVDAAAEAAADAALETVPAPAVVESGPGAVETAP